MTNVNKSFKFETFDMFQRIFIEEKYSNSTMRFIIKLKGKLDIEQFKKTIQTAIDVFPLISCKSFEYTFCSEWKFQEHPVEDFICIVEGKEGKEDEMIMDQFHKNLDIDNGFNMRFIVFQYPDHDSLLILINHMLCDATDFKNFLYMFCDIYTHPENVNDYSPMGDRGFMQLFRSLTFKENFEILTHKDDPPQEKIAFEFEGDCNRPFLEKRTLTQEDFDKLKAYSKAKQVTLNDIFFTALMRTFYKEFNRTVNILCDINLRKYIPGHKTAGFTNMITTIDCNIGEELGDTFEETLNKVSQRLTKEKDNIYYTKGLYLSEIVKRVVPYRLCKNLLNSSYSPSPLEMTNLGIIDKSKVFFRNVEASSVLLVGSAKYAPLFELSVCTFDKILSFCIDFYGTPSDQKIISDILDNFIRELTSVY